MVVVGNEWWWWVMNGGGGFMKGIATLNVRWSLPVVTMQVGDFQHDEKGRPLLVVEL
jgi:hypothetical protein